MGEDRGDQHAHWFFALHGGGHHTCFYVGTPAPSRHAALLYCPLSYNNTFLLPCALTPCSIVSTLSAQEHASAYCAARTWRTTHESSNVARRGWCPVPRSQQERENG